MGANKPKGSLLQKLRSMPIRFKLLVTAVVFVAGISISFWVLGSGTIAVLEPKGTIADQQRNLIFVASALSAVIIIPVFVLTFWVAWKYRENNKKARYQPEWSNSRVIESIWWGVPIAIIAVLAVITWITSHSLDPFKPLESDKKPLTVQVVALQWRWLFLYPEHNIASINYLTIPEDRPINFLITSDAPMNSFWIPQLGGQVYAMSGMQTKLHLMAEEPGVYTGRSANISGSGFASMDFTAHAVPEADFDEWVKDAQQSSRYLGFGAYNELSQPSENKTKAVFASVDPNLYDTIVMKYMVPGALGPRGAWQATDHEGH